MDTSPRVTPCLTVLTPPEIQQVHTYILNVLADVGVRVDSPTARQIFAQNPGARLDGDRVRLEAELVEWAIASAPEKIKVFDRRGEHRFTLGEDRTRFGIGVTNLYYQDPLTDDVTRFTRNHMALSVRLGDVLPQFDVVSTIGVVQDLPQDIADLYATLEMVANTTKPLVLLISDETLFEPALDMLEMLIGDLSEKPFVIPYLTPVTPLVMNTATTDKMIAAIERGLPIIFSNYGMAGMSTPISPAGTLILLTAELLAGLVFSQLIRPGTPVILGSLPSFFDMKALVDYYDPLTFLLNLACAEMMAHYHLPHAGTSGSGLGWGMDLLAGGLLWIDHLASCLGKVGLAPFVGGNLGSKAFAPALVVYSNEIIEQARRFASGFALDKESAALDDITQVGAGGHFLTTPLTLNRFRQEYYTSHIFPRLSLETWLEKGQPQAIQLLRERTMALLDGAQPPVDHDELLARGESFIRDFVDGWAEKQ